MNNLPDDKQNIDEIEDTDAYEHYLHYCVKHGGLEVDEAEEIIKNRDWKRVSEMMAWSDYVANSWEAQE